MLVGYENGESAMDYVIRTLDHQRKIEKGAAHVLFSSYSRQKWDFEKGCERNITESKILGVVFK